MSLTDYAQVGMAPAWHARTFPERMAVASAYGERTWAELNGNANRLLRVLRGAGLAAGDAVAIVLKNRPEFVEALLATMRGGLRLTPINFHLKADEIGYIVDNCEARAFIADAGIGGAAVEAVNQAPRASLKLAVGGALPGFGDYAAALAAEDGADIPDPSLGGTMLYTSGTTGRPKGVFRKEREPVLPQHAGTLAGYRPGEDCNLCTGPAYHAAPLLIDVTQPIVSGVAVVLMDKWDPEETLRLVHTHRVSHCHMVATMFHRLLQLPAEVKANYDIGSLRMIVHGAAPTPVHVKKAMIEWVGPILWEYYAATEGGGGFIVGSEEWLRKPGTVGRPPPEFHNLILDDDGNPCPPGVVGTIYMPAPQRGRFEYFKDATKTSSSYRGDHFTLGDMGYFDEDGYLFLTGRTAELIISGGVNIYPQEVDSELLQHPAVLDVCTIGVPSEEWGEAVKSVVQLRPGHAASPALANELVDFVRGRLAPFKCPRTIDFVDDLPRLPSGKIQRRIVREPYWAGRTKQI
jgi:long-chain acyl-CoA synthetase